MTRAKWAAVTGSTQYTGLADNLSQIGWHLLSKWIHSEVCLPMTIWVLRHVTNDSSGPETGALFTRGYWLHLPGLSIVTHVSSVTSHQLQAQYLTLIFITQPTNKFRLTNLNTKLILWPLVPMALRIRVGCCQGPDVNKALLLCYRGSIFLTCSRNKNWHLHHNKQLPVSVPLSQNRSLLPAETETLKTLDTRKLHKMLTASVLHIKSP